MLCLCRNAFNRTGEKHENKPTDYCRDVRPCRIVCPSADRFVNQAQTQSGGVYNFIFSGLSTSSSSGGSITFSARGDYTFNFSGPSNPIEVLTGSAESLNFGVMGVNNANTTTAFDYDDNFWSKTFLLSSADNSQPDCRWRAKCLGQP